MKFIYKLVILGMVFLVSNTTFAQVYQYSDDGTKACIDCFEEGPEDKRIDCFCFGPFQLIGFTNSINAAASGGLEYDWLLEQEELLKFEIEKRFGRVGDPFPSFRHAQFEFFNSFAPIAEQGGVYRDRIRENLQSEISFPDNGNLYRTSKEKYVVLNAWTKELENIREGRPRQHYFGDLKYDGQRIEGITDGLYLIWELTKHDDEYNNQLNRVRRRQEILDKLKFAEEHQLAEGVMSQRFITQYEQLPFRQAMEFMTEHMARDFSEIHPPLISNPQQQILDNFGPQIADPLVNDYYYPIYDMIFGQSVPLTPVTPYEVSTEKAIYEYAEKTNFNTATRDFLKDNLTVKNELKEYLKFHEYSQGALDFSKELLTKYSENQSFTHDNYTYALDSGASFYIDFQDQQNPNEAFTMVQHNTPPFSTFNGLDKMLASLSSLENPRGEFIGQFALELLRDNGVQIPSNITAADMFSIFSFTPREPYANLGRYTIGFDFRNNIGQILWDNNVRFFDMLGRPYVIEGALALTRGESFDFVFREMVYDLSNTLQLNDIQKGTLISSKLEAEGIDRYLRANNNSQEAIDIAKKAINLLLEGEYAQVILFADCTSWEYATQADGYKACGITGMTNVFPVFRNGNLESPTIYSSAPIYFTMPSSWTNGRAATVSAAAYNLATAKTEAWVMSHPGVSDGNILAEWKRILVFVFQQAGGTISVNNYHNVFRTAPFVRSFTLTNCG